MCLLTYLLYNVVLFSHADALHIAKSATCQRRHSWLDGPHTYSSFSLTFIS